MDTQTLARLANTPPVGKGRLLCNNPLYTTINGSEKIEEVLDAPQVSLYMMSGNTQKPVTWMMDSGASQHFTPYIEDFTTYTQHRGVEISLSDNSIIKSTRVGSVTIRTNRGYDLILSDVLHVPQTHSRILLLRSCPTCHRIRHTVIDIARESSIFHFFCIILRLDPCWTGLLQLLDPRSCHTALSDSCLGPHHVHCLTDSLVPCYLYPFPLDIIMTYDSDPDSDLILSMTSLLTDPLR